MSCPYDYTPVDWRLYVLMSILLAVVIFFAVVDSSTLARWFFM